MYLGVVDMTLDFTVWMAFAVIGMTIVFLAGFAWFVLQDALHEVDEHEGHAPRAKGVATR